MSTVVEMKRRRGTESPEYSVIRPWFFHAVENYVEHRVLDDDPVFAAILSGDLKGIVNGADHETQRDLFLMLKYLHNHAPSGCWGSELALGRWLGGPQNQVEVAND